MLRFIVDLVLSAAYGVAGILVMAAALFVMVPFLRCLKR